LAASAIPKKIKKKVLNCVKNVRDMNRDKVMETVKELPQEFDLEELIERLVFVEKVEKGLEQIKEGKTVSHEQVKDMIKKW
jgi:predicted transcriptional regulator